MIEEMILPSIDKARFAEMFRTLSAEDAIEILDFVIEDIDGFARQLGEADRVESFPVNAVLHKIRGFASQFHLTECAAVAGRLLASDPSAIGRGVATLSDELARARVEIMALRDDGALMGRRTTRAGLDDEAEFIDVE